MVQKSGINPTRRSTRQRFIADGMRLLRIAAASLSFASLVAVGSIARAQAPAIPATGGLDCNGLAGEALIRLKELQIDMARRQAAQIEAMIAD